MQERLARLANRRSAVNPTSRTNGPTASLPIAKSRRRHAAQKSRVAALAMSVSTTVGLSAYFYQLDASAVSARAAAAGGAVTAGVVSSTAPGSSTTVPTDASPTSLVGASATTAVVAKPSTAVSPTGLNDGIFAGQTSSNRWGPVQVQITVSGGQIKDVTALQVPYDNGQSMQINDYAAPILRSETLQAQRATINTVSGATYTSHSYMKSLQSAIDVARTQAVG